MRALITGITGFAGSHLAEYLLAEHPDVEVHGTYRWRSRMDNVEHLRGKIHLVETDLRDFTSVLSALERTRPDYVFHLAAQSFVPASWTAPNETLTTNITGQTNLFEAIRALRLDPVVQIACSSEQYGLVLPHETPIKETNPLRPLSSYAVSKVAQDFLGYQYFQSYGLKAIRTRGFNHTGPRRGQVFVTSNFCSQVAAIELGLQEPVIRVGNLEAIRDFTDVRDMVRAYWLAVTRAKPGEVYNIATGHGIHIREMLDQLLALSTAQVKVEVDPERLRPSDVEILIGDSSKFRADTGWEPRIPFAQTLSDLLAYWRETLAARQARLAAAPPQASEPRRGPQQPQEPGEPSATTPLPAAGNSRAAG
jgi:GDP-4-dehydro-6-deoxy-D-mannose reductase